MKTQEHLADKHYLSRIFHKDNTEKTIQQKNPVSCLVFLLLDQGIAEKNQD